MNNSLISLINKEKRKTFVFIYFLSKHQTQWRRSGGGDGGIYPLQYLTGGMAYVIIPPMLCISDRQIDRTVQEAASGNDTLTGNCVHKSADFLLSTIYP